MDIDKIFSDWDDDESYCLAPHLYWEMWDTYCDPHRLVNVDRKGFIIKDEDLFNYTKHEQTHPLIN